MVRFSTWETNAVFHLNLPAELIAVQQIMDLFYMNFSFLSQVTIFVHKGAHYVNDATQHIKLFETERSEEIDYHVRGKSFTKGKTVFSQIFELLDLQKIYCDSFLGDKTVLNELKTAELVIGDSLYACSALVAAKFDIPHVVIVESGLGTPILELYHISTYPSYTPQMMSGLSPDMGLVGRVKNFVFYLARFFMIEVGARGYGVLKTKYDIKPQESIWKILSTVDLVLLERDMVLDYAMPIPPCKCQ